MNVYLLLEVGDLVGGDYMSNVLLYVLVCSFSKSLCFFYIWNKLKKLNCINIFFLIKKKFIVFIDK